jgi:hypothetical protein
MARMVVVNELSNNSNSKAQLTCLKQLTWELTLLDGLPAIGKFKCKTIYKRTLRKILNTATLRHILNALHCSLLRPQKNDKNWIWHKTQIIPSRNTRRVNIPSTHNPCKPIIQLEWSKLLQYIMNIIRNRTKKVDINNYDITNHICKVILNAFTWK